MDQLSPHRLHEQIARAQAAHANAINLCARAAVARGDAARTGQVVVATRSQRNVILRLKGAPSELAVAVERLREALVHRSVIEQAKGMVMDRARCTPDTAYHLLVTISQAKNRRLRDVAADLVAELVAAGELKARQGRQVRQANRESA